MKFFSRPAHLEQARHLGLTIGKTLAAESLDELTLAFDLAIHTARPDHSRDRPLRQGGGTAARLGGAHGRGGDASGALLGLAGGTPA